MPYRKRLHRRETGRRPRFLTFSCYQRLQLFGTPRLRAVFLAHLRAARAKYRFELIAYVVMPEHAHLIVCPPDLTEGPTWADIAEDLKSDVGREIIGRWRKLNAPVLERLRTGKNRYRFWQTGGGFDRNVRSDAELTKEIRYVHHNPVERGLAASPLEWDASSARFWAARCEGLPVEECGVPCDWPPGDERAWAVWQGFV